MAVEYYWMYILHTTASDFENSIIRGSGAIIRQPAQAPSSSSSSSSFFFFDIVVSMKQVTTVSCYYLRA